MVDERDRGSRPNILFFHVDNLGLGELGCYGGGILRGADTRRIDQFAQQGLKLWHYIVEAQCTPTRSALMTGRYPIRSGTHTVAVGGEQGGLVAWERTMGDILSKTGYATACLGKWHVGAETGRWPTDHGFDEWYGPPRSYEECLWVEDPWYDPRRDPLCYMYEGRKGEVVQKREQLTPEVKRNVDEEYLRRSKAFMERSSAVNRPFYLYFNHSLMHLPMLPRDEFKGASGQGDWADCLLELDHDFGELLDALDQLGVTENTVVVFAGDNGPEEQLLARGTAGFFEGSYFTSAEGGIRTPCLIRWLGRVQANRQSNELVHVTDMFTTLLKWAGCETPADRVIDGVDQDAFFRGEQENSSREGCILWVGERMHGIKWQNFKVLNIKQRYFFDPAPLLGTPHLINLVIDPKEREPISPQYMHTWVLAHVGKILKEFEASVQKEPVIPAGAPVNYIP